MKENKSKAEPVAETSNLKTNTMNLQELKDKGVTTLQIKQGKVCKAYYGFAGSFILKEPIDVTSIKDGLYPIEAFEEFQKYSILKNNEWVFSSFNLDGFKLRAFLVLKEQEEVFDCQYCGGISEKTKHGKALLCCKKCLPKHYNEVAEKPEGESEEPETYYQITGYQRKLIRSTLALINCMIGSGEEHSETSRELFSRSIAALDELISPPEAEPVESAEESIRHFDAEMYLLEKNCDNPLLNHRPGRKCADRIYASDAMEEYASIRVAQALKK